MDNKAEMYQTGTNREEARAKLFNLLGPNNDVILPNDNDGEAARLSKRSIDKIMSNSASNKSMHNGFTRKQHYAVASDIDKLFEESVRVWSHPDKSGAVNVIIHRYATSIHFRRGVAYITVKESTQHGKRVYSAELMEIEKLESMLAEAGETPSPTSLVPNPENKTKKPVGMLEEARKVSHTLPHHGLYKDNIRKLRDTVNTQDKNP